MINTLKEYEDIFQKVQYLNKKAIVIIKKAKQNGLPWPKYTTEEEIDKAKVYRIGPNSVDLKWESGCSYHPETEYYEVKLEELGIKDD